MDGSHNCRRSWRMVAITPEDLTRCELGEDEIMAEHQDLELLSDLIRCRNALDREISEIIGRPAHTGHIGEFVASRIFDIALVDSASNKGFDGRFSRGELAGATLNVKKYSRNERTLDINPRGIPDFYLVLTGPTGQANSSRDTTQPWAIEAVYLFHGPTTVENLELSGVRIGTATSVRRIFWDEAEIFPSPNNSLLIPTQEQVRLLRMFR